MSNKTVSIDVQKDLFGANKGAAISNADEFKKHGIHAFDVMGSVGSGKTLFIEALCEKMSGRYKILMVAGDLATRIDADRVASHGIDTVQINTGNACHLDARMVRFALKDVDLSKYELVFIENVGNLICPAGYSLGVEKRIVLLGITEGPYMVRKHPLTIKRADIIVINKIDLAEVLDFDVEALVSDVREVDSDLPVFLVSSKTGQGIDEVVHGLGL
ncbi:MAG: hydrogenase accessory protein HypB [Candidatus Thorarchaeota archaeon]|nr:MAG: hydrogenase accessory protein HypB [Candidatus Thorarchaeota archaeon]